MHHSYKTHSNHSIQILYSAEWNYLNTWQIGDHKRRNVQWNLWQFIFSLCFKIWSMFIIASSLPTRFEWIPAAGLLNCSIFVSLLYFQHRPENIENSIEPLKICDDLIDYANCSNTLSDLLDERSVSFFRRRPSFDNVLLTLSHRAWLDNPEG